MVSAKINILGIAPYEAMKCSMQRIADSLEDIQLDAYVGDMKDGADILQRNLGNDYDVIISRGGTAETISKLTSIPVVDIPLSVYDVLRTIKLAENYADRYAIVGFSSITEIAHLLCNLLQYSIDIYTIHSEEEVRSCVVRLKQEGYRMVIGDMITYTTAMSLGLNAILITSGNEAIASAFDNARKLSASYLRLRQENRLLREALTQDPCHIVVLSETGELLFSNRDSSGMESLHSLLRRELPHVLASGPRRLMRTASDTLLSIRCHVVSHGPAKYVVFYVTSSKHPVLTDRTGLSYLNEKEIQEGLFNSFYSVSGAMGQLQSTIEQVGASSFPVMIIGEDGTGKGEIAQILYTHSTYRNNPFICIDCELLDAKSWNYLTESDSSPLNDTGNTLYLKNLPALPQEWSKALLARILDANVGKRNRLIFSCVSEDGHNIPGAGQEFVKYLSCLTVCLPPLRDRAMEIPSLSSIYLGSLNVALGKQIIGFDTQAMRLLQEYNWPRNYTQFKRILTELATLTTTPYISSHSVITLLDRERGQANGKGLTPGGDAFLNLNRPLDEITHEILLRVLEKNGGNQSATAKQLGISRSTLWRYLSRSN